MDDLVERIRALCKERGTSITKVEEKLGYANGTIGKWKKARKPAPLEKVMQVADELDTTAHYLITGEQKTPADPETDGRSKEFMQLFEKLTPEQQDMILAQLRGVVGTQDK